MSRAEEKQLDDLDRILLRRICNLPSSAPIPALYLETGAMRISTILKARRVNYLHYLAQLPYYDMLARFFRYQWGTAQEYDWCHQVRKDLNDLNLPTDLCLITLKSELSWKTLVKKQIKIYEFKELMKLKSSLSKLGDLNYSELVTQNYLLDFNENIATTILRFRTRMSNFSGNHKSKEQMKSCPLCGLHEDSQKLVFKCNKVLEAVKITFEYGDIFKEEIPMEIGPILKTVEKIREDASSGGPSCAPASC